MAEGAPLLRAYRLTPIEGSNPSLSAIYQKGVRAYALTPFWYMAESDDLVRAVRFDKFASKANLKRAAARRSPEGVTTALGRCDSSLTQGLKAAPP